jgi:hypothetical protein
VEEIPLEYIKYPESKVPCKTTIDDVMELHSTGYVLKKKKEV